MPGRRKYRRSPFPNGPPPPGELLDVSSPNVTFVERALCARLQPHAKEPIIHKRSAKSQTKAITLSLALLPIVTLRARIRASSLGQSGHRDNRIGDADHRRTPIQSCDGNNFHLRAAHFSTEPVFSTVLLAIVDVAYCFRFTFRSRGRGKRVLSLL